MRVKKSKISLWEKTCGKVNIKPYQPTPKLVNVIGAVPRVAGYKDRRMCINETKQLHDRKNHPTPGELTLALKDVERALKRNTGPGKKVAMYGRNKGTNCKTVLMKEM